MTDTKMQVKCSNNEFFRVNPVYSFLDSGALGEIEVTVNNPNQQFRVLVSRKSFSSYACKGEDRRRTSYS